jgi:hypothetical protein
VAPTCGDPAHSRVGFESAGRMVPGRPIRHRPVHEGPVGRAGPTDGPESRQTKTLIHFWLFWCRCWPGVSSRIFFSDVFGKIIMTEFQNKRSLNACERRGLPIPAPISEPTPPRPLKNHVASAAVAAFFRDS